MTERLKRAEAYQIHPTLYQSLLSLDEASGDQLPKRLLHLIKLYASQLNQCVFCLERHCNEARQDGVDQLTLDVLLAWREAKVFSHAEKAALNWTECLTQLPQHHQLDSAYQQLETHYNKEEVVAITGLIIAINGWNRLAIAFGFES